MFLALRIRSNVLTPKNVQWFSTGWTSNKQAKHALKHRLAKLEPTEKSRPGAKLRSKPTDKASSKYFAFGNFAALHRPEKKVIEKSETAVHKITSFDSLRIFPTVREAMIQEIKEGYNLKSTYVKSKDELELKPSPVQIAAIRKINKARTVPKTALEKANSDVFRETLTEYENSRLKIFTVAAETGSGKTWAYLASVFSKLKEDDLELFNQSKIRYEEAKKHGTIRAVILLPTHDLVEQVYATAHRAATLEINQTNLHEKVRLSKQYSEFFLDPEHSSTLDLNVVKWSSGDSHEKLFRAAKRGRIDVLICTPAKIQGLTKLENVNSPFRLFNHVEYCVVDEADTLMDESWFHDTFSVIQRFNRLKDLVMCSATIPKEFQKSLKFLVKDEKSIIPIVTPQIHQIPKQIVVKVLDATVSPYNGSKTRCLAQAIYAIHKEGTEDGLVKRIIVFVNAKKDVEPLIETLITKYGHNEDDIVGITGRDSALDRQEKLEPFLKPATQLEAGSSEGKIKVLVTTDLLARGLNFQGIKNVILMDIPSNSVDLIHRVGRTGRMRQSGRVFIIIDKTSRKSWIKGLPKAIKNGATIG